MRGKKGLAKGEPLQTVPWIELGDQHVQRSWDSTVVCSGMRRMWLRGEGEIKSLRAELGHRALQPL